MDAEQPIHSDTHPSAERKGVWLLSLQLPPPPPNSDQVPHRTEGQRSGSRIAPLSHTTHTHAYMYTDELIIFVSRDTCCV